MTSKITYSWKPNFKAVIIKSINNDTLKLQHCYKLESACNNSNVIEYLIKIIL